MSGRRFRARSSGGRTPWLTRIPGLLEALPLLAMGAAPGAVSSADPGFTAAGWEDASGLADYKPQAYVGSMYWVAPTSPR